MQDNLSRSVKGTLRGLHFQEPTRAGQAGSGIAGTRCSTWRSTSGSGSPRFGRWVGVELAEDPPRQLWIPPGFAHGFCVLSESADFFYKCTELYAPGADRVIAWNDPHIGIPWPIEHPLLSAKDAAAPLLDAAPVLPRF